MIIQNIPTLKGRKHIGGCKYGNMSIGGGDCLTLDILKTILICSQLWKKVLYELYVVVVQDKKELKAGTVDVVDAGLESWLASGVPVNACGTRYACEIVWWPTLPISFCRLSLRLLYKSFYPKVISKSELAPLHWLIVEIKFDFDRYTTNIFCVLSLNHIALFNAYKNVWLLFMTDAIVFTSGLRYFSFVTWLVLI